MSLTFDDGDADQMAAARVLHRYRLPATFYIITGAVGAPGYVTRSDLRQLAADGNEIGGHTVSHLRLTALTTAEARRQVCDSRSILARWGYRADSFAYPGGADSRRTEAIVRACGYTSARGVVGLRAPGCPGCALTESIPPRRPLALRTAGEVDSSWTLRDLERTVTAAEAAGGLAAAGLPPRLRRPPLWWPGRARRDAGLLRPLARPAAAAGHRGPDRGPGDRRRGGADHRSRRPVAEARRIPPRTSHRPRRTASSTRHWSRSRASGAVSASLETTSASPSSTPRCWMEGGYGRNTARWQRTTDRHAGRWAERLTITSYHSGDAKLLPRFDLGECSLPVRPGRSYTLGTWYQSTARTQYSVYYRTWSGRWAYWTSSPYFQASPGWAQARWATPPVPAGASGLSFGLALFSEGLADHGLLQHRRDPARPWPGGSRTGSCSASWPWPAWRSRGGRSAAAGRAANPVPVEGKRTTSSSSSR